MRNRYHHLCGLIAASVAWCACLPAAAQHDHPGAPSAPTTQPAAQSNPEGTPRLEVDPPVFDFGRVWLNTPVKGSITLKNVGDAPLTLKARSSCGCTVISRPKSPLPPGETTKVSISYKTSHPGRAQKKITLTTNDPTQTKVIVLVKGFVKRFYEADPWDRILFRDIGADTLDTQTIKLINKYEKPLHLKLDPEQKFRFFTVSLKEIEPGQEYEFTATTIPPFRMGQNREKAILATGLEEYPTVDVNMYANVRPPVSVQPPSLYVSAQMNTPFERAVRVQYRAAEPVQITEIKATPSSITVEPVTDPPATKRDTLGTHHLRVKLPPFADLPERGAKIEILTDAKDPKYQKLEVLILKRGGSRRKPTTQPAARATRSPNRGDAETARKRIHEALQRSQKAKGKPGSPNQAPAAQEDTPPAQPAEPKPAQKPANTRNSG